MSNKEGMGVLSPQLNHMDKVAHFREPCLPVDTIDALYGYYCHASTLSWPQVAAVCKSALLFAEN